MEKSLRTICVFIFFFGAIVVQNNAEAPAHVRTLADYRARAAAIKAKTPAQAPEALETLEKTRSPQQPPQPSIAASLPGKAGGLTEPDKQDLLLLAQKIAEVHGQDIGQAFIQSAVTSLERLRAVLLFMRTNRKKLDTLIKDQTVVVQLLRNPKVLLEGPAKPQRSLLDQTLLFMTNLKKYMTPSQWAGVMHEYIGRVLTSFWQWAWVLVKDVVTEVVGPEKIYKVTRDGEIKTDAQGKRLPRLLPEYTIGDNGEAVKTMIPSKWYNALEDPNSLLGQFVMAGVDGSVRSVMKSMDILFFRPLVGVVLKIPQWKLSHLHYRLAMTEARSGGAQLITPDKLASAILRTANPIDILITRFPFDIRTILSQKRGVSTVERAPAPLAAPSAAAPAEAVPVGAAPVAGAGAPQAQAAAVPLIDPRVVMLETAITKHLWSEYEPLWGEIQKYIKVKIDKQKLAEQNRKFEYIPKGDDKKLPKQKVLMDRFLTEAGNVAWDTGIAKLMEGPLAPHVLLVDLALRLPRMMFHSHFEQTPATTLYREGKVGPDGNLLPAEPLSAQEIRNIKTAIALCEFIGREARHNTMDQNTTDTAAFNKTCTITYQDGGRNICEEYIFKGLPFSVVNQLLEKQEKILKCYLPFMHNIVQESYESYLMKLLMPRLVFQLLPAPVRQQLGITSIADAAANIETLKKGFRRTYNTLLSISSLLTLIQQLRNSKTFAGNYVRTAEVIRNFLLSTGAMINELYPVERDPWMDRVLEGWRMVRSKPGHGPHSTKVQYPDAEDLSRRRFLEPRSWFFTQEPEALTMTDRRMVRAAQLRSNIANPVLPWPCADIMEYLNAQTNQDTKIKIKDFSPQTVQVALAKQKTGESRFFDVDGNPIRFTYASFISYLNAWYLGTSDGAKNAIRPDIAARRIPPKVHKGDGTVDQEASDRIYAESLPPRDVATEVSRRARELLVYAFTLQGISKESYEEQFFSGGQKRLKNQADLERDAAAFQAPIELKVLDVNIAHILSHMNEFFYLLDRAYVRYGLREILEAFDEHYAATGEKINDLPAASLGRIALKEGMAHLVGYGADKLLMNGLGRLMGNIDRKLQEEGHIGGYMLQNILNQQIRMLLGGDARGRTNAYHAARLLMRNVFDYGIPTALSSQGLQGAVMSKFMPGMAQSGAGEYMELMAHARLAAKSGKAPNPIIAQKLKRAGIDYKNLPAESEDFGEFDDDSEGANMPFMPHNAGPKTPPAPQKPQTPEPKSNAAPPQTSPVTEKDITPAIRALIQKFQAVSMEKGEEAAMAFLESEIPKLSAQEQSVMKRLLGGTE